VKLVHLAAFITKKLHPLLKANTFEMVFFRRGESRQTTQLGQIDSFFRYTTQMLSNYTFAHAIIAFTKILNNLKFNFAIPSITSEVAYLMHRFAVKYAKRTS